MVRPTRILLLALVIALPLLPTSAAAADPYPNQLPDFAHPDAPHLTTYQNSTTVDPFFPPFSPDAGETTRHPTGQRWLLVIYVRFNDYSSQVPESQIKDRFFPLQTFGTVSNYFWRASFFNFTLNPAQETYGAANDGFVTVDLGSSADFNAKSVEDQNGTILNAVDPFVNFAHYDGVAGGGNGDGTISWDELAVFWMATSQPTPTDAQNCGKTRHIPDNKELDGKKLVFLMADARSATNTITLTHELGHQALNVTDLYGIGVNGYALGAGTCSTDQNLYFYPSAYERVHWGWDEPVVVTKDGFYSVFNTDTDGPVIYSFILYDPDKGTDDYFIVENRQQRNNTYDWSVPDSGLVIYRVHDTSWPNNKGGPRLLNLMRPDDAQVPDTYGGSNTDAWDPSDTNSPQRTMARSWDDGTPSNVAVRAIRQAQVFTSVNSITAYFDVRGPGVLVDPTTAQGALLRPSVPIGGTVDVSLPVMNTGEVTDTFDFTILVPSGWSATTQQLTLTAGQQATATITVTASSSATAGFRTVAARGRSTTDSNISTTVDFFMDVTKRPTSVQYTGDTTAEYSDPATVSAQVTDAINNQPLANWPVTFGLGSQTATATTDANGVATTTIVVDQMPGVTLVSTTIDATATHDGATDFNTFIIDKENLTLVITSSLSQPLAGWAAIVVQATEENDGAPGTLTLATAQVNLQPTLTTTPYAQQVPFDSAGSATGTFAGLPSDLWTVNVAVVSDYFEAPPLAAELVVFDTAAKIGGSAGGTDMAGQKVKLTAAVSYASSDARGTLGIQSKPSTFKATDVRWVVVAGGRALVEALGEYNNAPAVLRADIRDSGLPGGQQDRFSLRITDLDGTLLYQSGDVQRENGNVVISGTR